MAKDKLKRWAENKTFPHVFEPNLMPIIRENATFMKGLWREEFYKNNRQKCLDKQQKYRDKNRDEINRRARERAKQKKEQKLMSLEDKH